jgi:hypothetical protein
MFRRAAIFASLLLLVILLPLSAAKIKLYLKDGGDLVVTEYKIDGERVRYYSAERDAWEEIPLELLDLDRTRQEQEKNEAWRAEREQELKVERQAERKARTELHNVPLEDGVYHLDGDKITPVQQAVVDINGSKKRTLLKVLAPIPAVTDKSTIDLEGEKAPFVVSNPRPMFYLRLEKTSRVGLLRMQAKKDGRRAQVIQKGPGGEMFEEQEDIEVFRQQLAPGVYKVWPVNPLSAGEYAVYEYSPGEGDLRIWDFGFKGGEENAPGPR